MGISKTLRKIYIKLGYKIWGRSLTDALPFGTSISQDWDPFVNRSFSQEGEDLVLYRLLDQQKKGVYVDVGAHHPYRFSNTFKFYQLGWSGINVDPLPGSKALLDEKRPRDINIEAGVVNQKNVTLTYHMFAEPALNTFDEAVAQERIRGGFALQEKRQIPCYTLAELLSRHLPAQTAIDFLTIDVEGLDLQVLQSNNWSLYKPRYIVAESLSTHLAEEFNAPIAVFLKAQGYALIAKTANSLVFSNQSATK